VVVAVMIEGITVVEGLKRRDIEVNWQNS
jgi:hypothetical protein